MVCAGSCTGKMKPRYMEGPRWSVGKGACQTRQTDPPAAKLTITFLMLYKHIFFSSCEGRKGDRTVGTQSKKSIKEKRSRLRLKYKRKRCLGRRPFYGESGCVLSEGHLARQHGVVSILQVQTLSLPCAPEC